MIVENDLIKPSIVYFEESIKALQLVSLQKALQLVSLHLRFHLSNYGTQLTLDTFCSISILFSFLNPQIITGVRCRYLSGDRLGCWLDFNINGLCCWLLLIRKRKGSVANKLQECFCLYHNINLLSSFCPNYRNIFVCTITLSCFQVHIKLVKLQEYQYIW